MSWAMNLFHLQHGVLNSFSCKTDRNGTGNLPTSNGLHYVVTCAGIESCDITRIQCSELPMKETMLYGDPLTHGLMKIGMRCTQVSAL